ncbi:MAG: YIP1 family protein [bacterium]
MSGLETIYYMFTNPAISVRGLQENRPVGWAFLVVLLATISTNVGGVLISFLNLNVAKIILSFGLLARVIFIIDIWIVGTAIIHLFAEWFDGEGKVSTLFTALGFCFLPAILTAPFALLIQNCPTPTKILLFLSFNLLILLWIVRLEIVSIREVYHVSSFRAVMVISTPVVLGILGIISIITIALLMSFFIASSSLPKLPFFIFP